MSAWTVAFAIVFGTLLALTADRSIGGPLWKRWLSDRNRLGLIPGWALFSTPPDRNIELLWRARAPGGEVGPWVEAVRTSRGPAFVDIRMGERMAVSNCAYAVWQQAATGERGFRPVIGIDYLLILHLVSGKVVRSAEVEALQFVVVESRGRDRSLLFRPVFVSHWHRCQESEGPADTALPKLGGPWDRSLELVHVP